MGGACSHAVTAVIAVSTTVKDFLFGVLRERHYYLCSRLAPSSVQMSHGLHIFYSMEGETCHPVWYLAALMKFFPRNSWDKFSK